MKQIPDLIYFFLRIYIIFYMQGILPFKIKIPTATQLGDTTFYEFVVTDVLRKQEWHASFRYTQLKDFYNHLIEHNLKKHLIEFPHDSFWKFWKRTNSDSKLIEQRRVELQEFFKHILQNPYTQNHKLIRNFIKICYKRRDVAIVRSNSSQSLTNSPIFKYSGSLSPMTNSPFRSSPMSKSLYGVSHLKGNRIKQTFIAATGSSYLGNRLAKKYVLKEDD